MTEGGQIYKPGDKITIAGVYKIIPNTSRRWWQVWKPRLVKSDELAVFEVSPEHQK